MINGQWIVGLCKLLTLYAGVNGIKTFLMMSIYHTRSVIVYGIYSIIGNSITKIRL
jgi:hypothetical protein